MANGNMPNELLDKVDPGRTASGEELALKLRDPKFYIESFFKIRSKTQGIVPMKLYEHQKHFFNALKRHNRVVVNKARQMGFCFDPSLRVLTSDLRWKTGDEIQVGDEVVAVDESSPEGRGKKRRMRKAVVEAKREVFEEGVQLTLEDGRVLRLTRGHRMLYRKRSNSSMGKAPFSRGNNWINEDGRKNTAWKEAGSFCVGDEIRSVTVPWEEAGDYEDGWYGGLLDGEGSMSLHSRSGCRLNVSQVDGPVLDRARRYLQRNNYHYVTEEDDREPGESSKLGSKAVFRLCLNRMDEIFRIIGTTRPSRFLSRKFWVNKALPGARGTGGWVKVVKVEAVPKQRMIDLQTSEKTFVLEGLVSHNSKIFAAWTFHRCLTYPGTYAALVSYDSDQAKDTLETIKLYLSSIPDELRPTVDTNAKDEIYFPALSSKIKVIAAKEVGGRGFSFSLLHCSELGFWDHAEEKMGALLPTLPPGGGYCVAESTPSLIGSYYHRLCTTPDNGWHKLEYQYWWMYSEEQLEQIRREMNDPDKFAREYLLQWTGSGHNVFDYKMIQELMPKMVWEPGRTYRDSEGEWTPFTAEEGLTVFKPPRPGHTYVLGADVAENKGAKGDYSVAFVLDRDTSEEVACFRGKIDPDRFGQLLVRLGKSYNYAISAPEINSAGVAVLGEMRRLGYPNYYVRTNSFDKVTNVFSDKLGWRTTTTTRPKMIADFNKAFREGEVIFHSKALYDEMLTFVYDESGRPAALSGAHDDCVLAACISLQAFGSVVTQDQLGQLDWRQFLPSGGGY